MFFYVSKKEKKKKRKDFAYNIFFYILWSDFQSRQTFYDSNLKDSIDSKWIPWNCAVYIMSLNNYIFQNIIFEC